MNLSACNKEELYAELRDNYYYEKPTLKDIADKYKIDISELRGMQKEAIGIPKSTIKHKEKGSRMQQNNPFKEGSASYQDWETLKDLQWHCTKCELKSGQAKTWQTWRDEKGIQFEEPTHRRWEARIFCNTCKKKTPHRKLKTLELLDMVSIRAQITPEIAKKVKDLYGCTEAVLLRKLSLKELEIDHKFPQIRWNKNEEKNDDLSDEDLKSKFILLNRNNNLLKSRQCESCFKTNKRGSFPGINFWYEGDENWIGDPHDKKGCIGCFWYDPYEWRRKLNELVNSKNN